MAVFLGCAGTCAGFHFERPGCSWYEEHMLGGCVRREPRAGCVALAAHSNRHQERLAVIVPFRGSQVRESFDALCSSLPAHLDDQGVKFHLLAVNQVDAHPFNRAALANVGFQVLSAGGAQAGLHAKGRHRPFTCVAVHDVDRFPVTRDGNISCAPFTRRYYTCQASRPHVLHPSSFTGGVLVLQPHLLQAVNGFSNEFWGWGHEDNELYLRLRSCGMRPYQPPQLDWCMGHRDCAQCKRAKPTQGLPGLRAETRSIALMQEALRRPDEHRAQDGLATVNYSAASQPRSVACGGHTIHVLDVALHRHRERRGGDELCVADGGRNDNGCVAQFSTARLPDELLAQGRRGLPQGSRHAEVVRATRSRAMYNFHYELDFETRDTQRRQLYRVAICAQEWQGRDAPATVRYQLLWRAVARRAPAKDEPRVWGTRFSLSKEFPYKGHFPCSLWAPPWLEASVGASEARQGS